MRSLYKYIIIILLLVSGSLTLLAQQYTIAELKAAYILSFGKYITWKNEDDIDIFRIGVVGNNTEVFAELDSISAKISKLNGKPVSVYYFKKIANITKTQVLYISPELNSQFNLIVEKLKGTNTLLVSDNCDSEMTMINFIYDNPKKSFEVNDKNIVEEKLIISNKLTDFAPTETNWQEQYIRSGELLESEKEKVKQQKEEIIAQQKILDSITSELGDQQQQLEFQTTILNEQKQDVLVRQRKIEEQKRVLNRQIAKIEYQRLILFMIIGLLALILSLSVYIYVLYKNKRKLNTRLQENNEEINNQKKQIEERNHELLRAFKKNTQQKAELAHAFDQISIQKEELEKAYKKIQEAARLKEIFLANTSHEIRTPLNAIIGFTNLLLKSSKEKKQLEYLNFIKNSGNNLLVIINDILDLSKIEEGKLTFESIDFDIYKLVSNVISTLNIKASEKNIKLSQNIEKKIPGILIGDPTRLNQILINLTDNAIKFTNNNGKVELNLRLIKDEAENAEILFSVSDTGIGIPEDKIVSVFESFTQAESSTTRKFGGTGLGLSIVKQLVELQNGKISVESKLGKGTTFTFRLGFTKSSLSSLSKGKTTDKSLFDESHPEQINILLTEDNTVNQQLAVDTITSWSDRINVDIAGNGKIAIEKLIKNDYHLILMDMQMPVMDGYKATEHIRNKLEYPKNRVPVIAMTAHAMAQEKEKCLALGMNEYISKPFDPDDLFFKIKVFTSFEVTKMIRENKAFNIQDYTEKKKEEPEAAKTEQKDQESDTVRIEDLKFKHIDLSYLNKIYKGKNDRIHKILKLYMTTVDKEISELNSNSDTQNWEEIKSLAHSLKPKMLYLGLNTLHEYSKTIEHNVKENTDLDKIPFMIEKIIETWTFAEEEIKEATQLIA